MRKEKVVDIAYNNLMKILSKKAGVKGRKEIMEFINEIEKERNKKKNEEKKFKINEYIELRLIDNTTYIYVLGNRFLACKRLLINLDKVNLEKYASSNSIDEIARIANSEKLNKTTLLGINDLIDLIYNDTQDISPEEEFWGHCSNLQTWVEHNYDTRILHSYLSFPLLKKLVDVGDQKAKSVFQYEIMKRFNESNQKVMTYLIVENYLKYLEPEQILEIKEPIIKYFKSLSASPDKQQIIKNATRLKTSFEKDFLGLFEAYFPEE